MERDRPCGSGGKRGRVRRLSRAARKRMLDRIHEVRRDAALPQFLTLTFPDFFPEQSTAKRRLDTMFKRWRRRWPAVSAIWRMEVITRKSGRNEGQVAPHFHLLVWGGVDVARCARDWFEVNGSSDYAHVRHGCKGAPLESWKGAVFYCAKYCAKVDDTFETDGRCWGTHNRGAMPLDRAPLTSVCTVRTAQRARRWVRGWVRSTRPPKAHRISPLNLYTCDPGRWLAATLDL